MKGERKSPWGKKNILKQLISSFTSQLTGAHVSNIHLVLVLKLDFLTGGGEQNPA